ncbi:MAG: hypothetical protein LBE34_12270 [Flavobacteriaceae bacterium]|jgi:hypothetical protein|nr:hypothetical protein [Flavobacteriaceae bacterium]
MEYQEMYNLMFETDSHLNARKKALCTLSNYTGSFKFLLDNTFNEDSCIQAISSYVLDDYLIQTPNLVLPYLSEFIVRVEYIKNESVKRIVSKILIRIVKKHKEQLSIVDKSRIAKYAVGWLVDDSKVATEANAMELLSRLKREFPDEFALGAEMVEINYYSRSIAYQNKGKKYLALMHKEE